ncbi:hypothetical protein BD779DRAFT_903559 [Infundibulicybe gibba]|nr:hypothetical protein BD779DRAFT_903559 [Infundibulicybe gibba]
MSVGYPISSFTHDHVFPTELRRQLPQGLPMLRNVSSYWRTNLFETTSGNFATPSSSSTSTKLVWTGFYIQWIIHSYPCQRGQPGLRA